MTTVCALISLEVYWTDSGAGKWIAEIPTAEATSLEMSETRLEGENREMFLQMMRGMLTWRPEDRKTAKQMLDEPWLKNVE